MVGHLSPDAPAVQAATAPPPRTGAGKADGKGGLKSPLDIIVGALRNFEGQELLLGWADAGGQG